MPITGCRWLNSSSPPLDQAPADAWTCFPGLADGKPAQRLAHLLFGLIRECDFLIDIHTPTRGGRYVPITILPPQSLDKDGRILGICARGSAAVGIMRSNNDFYVSPGILCVEAVEGGYPWVYVRDRRGRAAGAGRRGKSEKGCILNALESLRMLSVKRSEPAEVHLMKEFVGLRAKGGGLLYNHARLGQTVKQGDLLATIRNIFGDEVEQVIAPIDGYMVRLTTLSTVSTGERVATLGIPEG